MEYWARPTRKAEQCTWRTETKRQRHCERGDGGHSHECRNRIDQPVQIGGYKDCAVEAGDPGAGKGLADPRVTHTILGAQGDLGSADQAKAEDQATHDPHKWRDEARVD
jgi:hypothetical protein